RPFWTWLWLGGMVMLVCDLVALYWVGLWQALTAKSSHRAASASLARILMLPWIGFALVALVVSLASMRGHREPSQGFFLGGWFRLGCAADIGFGAWARTKLLTEFRVAATRRFMRREGFWKRLLTGSNSSTSVEFLPAVAGDKG